MTNEINAVNAEGVAVVVRYDSMSRNLSVVLATAPDEEPVYNGPIWKARPRMMDGNLYLWGDRFQVDTTLVATVIDDWKTPPPEFAQSKHRSHLTPLPGGQRFQYLVANIGIFYAAERMSLTLATLGEAGWELVHTYDKSSNWFNGMEKGFMLFKRPVPDGVKVDQWAFSM